MLKPGGKILMITVPGAPMDVERAHDVSEPPQAPYSKATLTASLREAGLGWQKLRWFSFAALPGGGRGAVRRLDRQGRQRRFACPRPLNARRSKRGVRSTAHLGRTGTAGPVDHRAGVAQATGAQATGAQVTETPSNRGQVTEGPTSRAAIPPPFRRAAYRQTLTSPESA